MLNIFRNIFLFYYEWFRDLSKLSKKLWLIIIIKTVVILTVLNIFFPDFLWQFETQEEKINVISNSLLNVE